MAVNNDFLGQITDALVGRASEPGKLDDVAAKFGEIVRGAEKTVKSFDKMHAQLTAMFKESVGRVRGNVTHANWGPANALPSAQELTKIFNKITEPLFTEMHALAQATSKLSKNFDLQHKANQKFEQDSRNQFARLQQKLEARATRAIASPAPPVDRTSFQAQLTQAFSELKGVQAKAAAVQQTFEQHMLAQLRHEVKVLKEDVWKKIRYSARAGWSTPDIAMIEDVPATPYRHGSGLRPDYRRVKNKELEARDEWARREVIGGIEGGITARTRRPAHSTQYGVKKGAGMAAETTPAYLGSAGIKLENQYWELRRFIRHITDNIGDPGLAKGLYGKVDFHRKVGEKRQQNLGRGVVSREDVRLGEDIVYGIVAQVNSRLSREALPSSYHDSRREHFQDQAASRRFDQRQTSLLSLGVVRAGPYQSPRTDFPITIGEGDARRLALARTAAARDQVEKDNASLAEARRDRLRSNAELSLGQPWARPTRQFEQAEVAAFIGQHKGKPSVGSIQTAAQMANAVGYTGEGYFDLTNIVLAGQSAGRTARNTRAAQRDVQKLLAGGEEPVISKARQRMLSERGASPLDFLNPFGWGKKKQAVVGGPDLRGEMRKDALDVKLKKLADAIDATAKSFQHFEQVVAPQKRAVAGRQYAERDLAIERGLAGGRISLDVQDRRMRARGTRAGTLSARRDEAAISAQESTEHALGFSALEAQTSLDFARDKAARRAKQLAKTQKPGGGRKYSDKDIAEITGTMTALPGMRAARAEYAAQAAGLSAGPELEGLRKQTAAKYATARYGTGAEFAGARDVYAGQVEELLRSKTPYQKTQEKRAAIKEDERATRRELDSQETDRIKRGTLLEDGAIQKRALNAQRFGETRKKIDEDVAQHAIKAEGKVRGFEEADRAARAKFAKQEATLASRGGGRVAGSGGGAGGGRGGGIGGLVSPGQGGYGSLVGLGFLLAWDKSLKEVIKDSSIYAARTEMMEFATERMAKVSGLSAGEVNAEVNAIKNLNVTTQVAHQTVQRFMMMQIDVAKAAKLVAVAQDLAAISGADAMETVSRLSQAVLTGYTRNLHMMGLQVTAIGMMRELKAQRRAEGKTGEPSMMEQRQALVNKMLLEGAKVAGTYERSLSTAGNQFAYLRMEAQETMNVFGKEFLPVFGQVMLSMTGGLKTVRAHAEGFALLAKVLSGVSASLTVLIASRALSLLAGSAGLTALLGVAAPPVAAVVGIGTVAYLTRDKSRMNRNVAEQQQTLLSQRMDRLKAERADLFKNPEMYGGDGSDEFNAKLEQVDVAMKSVSAQIEATAQDLTKKLATEYAKREKDLDDWAAGTADAMQTVSLYFTGGLRGTGTKKEIAEESKRRFLEDVVGPKGSLADRNNAKDAVIAEAARQAEIDNLLPEIRNKTTEWLNTMGTEYLSASGVLDRKSVV